MMTALHIEEYTRGGFGGFLNRLRRNRLRVEHLFCDKAALKSISYEHYRGKIGWNSIDRFVKAQRNRILCTADTPLPEELGYKRFVSDELNRRLCENAALYLLRTHKDSDVRTVLLDREGRSVGLGEYLCDYADSVCVVTGAVGVWLAEARRLLNEKGAALRISKSADCLKNADLIIADDPIETPPVCPRDAVILSPYRPAVPTPAPVIYEYFFDLPQKFRQIKPPYLDDMYFASALYAMADAYELGGELFTRCGDGTVLHTRMSLSAQLKSGLTARESATMT